MATDANAEDELLDYEDDEAQEAGFTAEQKAAEAPKGKGYVGVHSVAFKDFLLKPELLKALTDCGFEHPSEVQQDAIPQAVLGQDVLCQAKSGMGKTAVFVIAVLQQLDPVAGEVQALVMCHTRELAFQICHEFKRFSTHMASVKVSPIYGGVPIEPQMELLNNKDLCPNIIVGTPGRIKQLTQIKEEKKRLNLMKIRFFVLDECDKMLEKLDMRKDVQDIFRMTPHQKQVMMFSATLAADIRAVCKKFMSDPTEIFVDNEAKLTLHGLVQHYVLLEEEGKNRKLTDLLDALDFHQVVIFVKSVERARALNHLLNDCNFPAVALFGGMEQEKRLEVYKQFKEGKKRILVATDLVGRGIDIERVNIVINYDMPVTDEQHGNGADTYLHRVGRAGRFGTKGLAISFVASDGDSKVLNTVQERFDVDITKLPDKIDTSSYMPE